MIGVLGGFGYLFYRIHKRNKDMQEALDHAQVVVVYY
jgi:hypothetical protein